MTSLETADAGPRLWISPREGPGAPDEAAAAKAEIVSVATKSIAKAYKAASAAEVINEGSRLLPRSEGAATGR